MNREYYQIEWGNGSVDVFVDRDEAIALYSADGEDEIAECARTQGYYTFDPVPYNGVWCMWSDAAKAHKE